MATWCVGSGERALRVGLSASQTPLALMACAGALHGALGVRTSALIKA